MLLQHLIFFLKYLYDVNVEFSFTHPFFRDLVSAGDLEQNKTDFPTFMQFQDKEINILNINVWSKKNPDFHWSTLLKELIGMFWDGWSAAVHLDNRVTVWVDVYYRKASLTLSNEYAWSRIHLIGVNNVWNSTCLRSFDKIQYDFSAASWNPFFEKENNSKCNSMQWAINTTLECFPSAILMQNRHSGFGLGTAWLRCLRLICSVWDMA